MAATAKKVINVAREEVGYLEKKSNKDLNSKTKNAGSANYTKYGEWFGDNPDYWCAMFICWCFYKAFGYKLGKAILCGVYSAACETMRQAFISAGRYNQTPKVGSLVFFSGSRHRGANHIAIIYMIKNGYIYTIEGNTSGGSGVIDNGGGVAYKSYKISNTRILGYGHPEYEEDAAEETSEPETSTDLEDTEMPEIEKGSKGRAVAVWQAIIGFTGKDVDGDFGSKTKTRTIEKQKAWFPNQKAEWDGIVGPKTWKKGLESV